jgi:peptidoglycan hydrolase-like protein with peptidoglycan-binding domain
MTTIKMGSRGSEVRNIQQRLNCQVTGVYNTPTYRAVVSFQQQNGVLDNGEVDEQTYDLLFPKSFVQVELESIKTLFEPTTPEVETEDTKPKSK